MAQAQRIVRLVVGPPGRVGREITRNRISFDIPKTSSKFPNKAKIQIYNLDPTTAAFIESDEQKNSVQLFAGYTGQFGFMPDNVTDNGAAPGLIFSGEIRKGKARTALKPPDRITTIEASDGGAGYRSARVNKSWSGQTTAFDLIDELARSWGVSIPIPDDITDTPIDSPVLAGRSADVMDSLAVSLGFNWWFEDGEIVVVSNNGDNGESAFLLTPQTGLIDSPEKTDKGLIVRCLLNPALRVKRIVQIEANDVTGFYLIQKLSHKGDSYDASAEFVTELECKAVTAGKSPTKAAKDANIVSKLRKVVIGAGLMFGSLAAAVSKASAPEYGYGNVFIAEFSSSEYGLVTKSESVKLAAQQVPIYLRDGGLFFV